MDLGLRGKTALIAAATDGIGLATAKALAAEGAHVAICGRNPEKLEAALKILGSIGSSGSQAIGITADITKLSDIERWHSHAVQQLGHPDIVVTNTGGPPAGSALAVTDEQWVQGFESTVLNITRLVRLCAPAMKEKRWGRIVHVTSLVAKEPTNLLAISSTLRLGLQALTKLQASELGPFGITVNAVLPGHTLTDRQKHLVEIKSKQQNRSMEDVYADTAARIALKRLAHPDEIGSAAAFLCSQAASYITGVNLLVDGGAIHGVG